MKNNSNSEEAQLDNQFRKESKVEMKRNINLMSSLPEELLIVSFTFLDVKSLGALVLTSKEISQKAKKDQVWRHHLKTLLEQVLLFSNYTPNIKDEIVTQFTTRDDWMESTALLKWWREERKTKSFYAQSRIKHNVDPLGLESIEYILTKNPFRYMQDEKFSWLVKDVTLREYYHQVGRTICERAQWHLEFADQCSRCPICWQKIVNNCSCKNMKQIGYTKVPKIKWY